MNEKTLQGTIESKVREVLFPFFDRYDMDSSNLDAILKWKPIVLILGNYSSGKSTFINELLGHEIQRTGQAPTDDSFTIITAPGPDDTAGEVRGVALVNDDRLPFTSCKKYGEQFTAHFTTKPVDSPQLENMAIIETPDDASIRIKRVAGNVCIGPEWDSQKGRFGYDRTLRYVLRDRSRTVD